MMVARALVCPLMAGIAVVAVNFTNFAAAATAPPMTLQQLRMQMVIRERCAVRTQSMAGIKFCCSEPRRWLSRATEA